ncbi:hypothetical protein [Luteimonas sp. TWI1437]|uniref:hypothetical protein n=1 Tax=unclassified Luteimonas TaxID=2629088 RepID=UPI0032097A57
MKYRWYKTMSHADAQHPRGTGTNRTGHLTLVQANHNIDSAVWFRDILFGGLAWAGGPEKERVAVSMKVEILGQKFGSVDLDITNTPSFESDQGNRVTVLHWGTLSKHMQSTDYSGKIVTIERNANGCFYLTIDDSPTGPAIV